MLTLGLLLYAGAAGYMAWNQKTFIFRVDPSVPDLAAAGLRRASETRLAARDGVMLRGWRIEPERADSPVIVYFHGNARTHERRIPRFRLLTEGGAGLVAYHYRGYGGSAGVPDELLLHADAAEILAETRRLYPGRKLILFGESLGSGVAVRLASEQAADALILDSPFLSMLHRAWTLYPWLPVPLLLQHPFRSDLAAKQIRAPALILHGDRDTVVPINDGEQLFALMPEPKTFRRYANAGHVAAFSHGAMEDIRAFLREKAAVDL